LGWGNTFTIIPNTKTTLAITNSIAEHFSDDIVDTRGVYVETFDMVNLFAINFPNTHLMELKWTC